MTRYALYYRLMDVAFFSQIILLVAAVFKASTGVSLFRGVMEFLTLILLFSAIILPMLLIFQRWMRDDFSETLWQKTAGTVLKFLILLPIPVMFGVALGFAAEVITFAPINDGTGLDPLAEAALASTLRALILLMLSAAILFTFAFQWHRWRASR